MGKKKSKSEKMEDEKNGEIITTTAAEKMKSKDYDQELERLHVELVKLQEWVKHKGLKILARKGVPVRVWLGAPSGFCFCRSL